MTRTHLQTLERADHPLELSKHDNHKTNVRIAPYLGEPRAAENRKHDRADEGADEALPGFVGRQAQERRLDELAAEELAAEEREAVVAHDERHGKHEPEETWKAYREQGQTELEQVASAPARTFLQAEHRHDEEHGVHGERDPRVVAQVVHDDWRHEADLAVLNERAKRVSVVEEERDREPAPLDINNSTVDPFYLHGTEPRDALLRGGAVAHVHQLAEEQDLQDHDHEPRVEVASIEDERECADHGEAHDHARHELGEGRRRGSRGVLVRARRRARDATAVTAGRLLVAGILGRRAALAGRRGGGRRHGCRVVCGRRRRNDAADDDGGSLCAFAPSIRFDRSIGTTEQHKQAIKPTGEEEPFFGSLPSPVLVYGRNGESAAKSSSGSRGDVKAADNKELKTAERDEGREEGDAVAAAPVGGGACGGGGRAEPAHPASKARPDRGDPGADQAKTWGRVSRAGEIALRVVNAAENGMDVFEIGAAGDKVEIAGNSATAMAYGLQWYFKKVLHTQTDWDNHKLLLPKKLPKVDQVIRHERTSKYSYYQNVCTVSYSSWTWGWEKWEKHIDWMALNGINMPLAFTGQEKVWQNTFRQFNISDAGLNKFFAGSGFLAWGRMGNVRGSWVKGPLPQKFIDDQFELQLKTLDRMKEFGMIPALPAFAGHIPEELKVHYPNAKITRSPNWNNFPKENCCVYLVDPVDSLYLEIGKKFIEEQTRLYNYTSSLYQCDTFNEMDPDTTDPVALANSSQAVINSMVAADPNAVWLMQGWLFQSGYWTKDLTKAYLGAVPNDKMIILDLYSEVDPIWNRDDNYFGKSWIYCVLHNFGGATGMRGDLPTLGSDPVDSLAKSDGTMIGVGLTMEGIYQNYVVYDLTLQMAWEKAVVEIPEWIKAYAYQRYNSKNEHAQKAWQVLSASVYNQTKAYGGVTKSIVMVIPHWKLVRDGFMPTVITYNPEDIVKAWNFLILASDELRNVDTYRHDLVDVTRQYLSDRLLKLYVEMKDGYENKTMTADKLSVWKDKFLKTIADMDDILSTNEDFLLGNWIADARALGAGDASLQDYYEYEARNLVTRWGDHNNNTVHDYAGKEWGGLCKGYYLNRWRIWLTEVCQSYAEGRPMNDKVVFDARESFELKWQLSHDSYPTKPRGDPVAISKRLYYEYIDSESGVWSMMLNEIDEADEM